MRVRAIDVIGDWQFGKGRNDYKIERAAIAQSIRTRLKSFLGDCFYDLADGIDWFNLLGTKLELELKLAISARILNTEGVVSLKEILVTVNTDRIFLVSYGVETIYGSILNQTVPIGE